MKLTLALLFVAFAAGAQVKTETVKTDSVFFTPKPSQLKTLQQFDAQIEQLRKQQMELYACSHSCYRNYYFVS